MTWNNNSDEDALLLLLAMIASVLVALACSGCATVAGPVTWRADQTAAAMQACSVACHPRGMGAWDSISGTCTCAADGPARGH